MGTIVLPRARFSINSVAVRREVNPCVVRVDFDAIAIEPFYLFRIAQRTNAFVMSNSFSIAVENFQPTNFCCAFCEFSIFCASTCYLCIVIYKQCFIHQFNNKYFLLFLLPSAQSVNTSSFALRVLLPVLQTCSIVRLPE